MQEFLHSVSDDNVMHFGKWTANFSKLKVIDGRTEWCYKAYQTENSRKPDLASQRNRDLTEYFSIVGLMSKNSIFRKLSSDGQFSLSLSLLLSFSVCVDLLIISGKLYLYTCYSFSFFHSSDGGRCRYTRIAVMIFLIAIFVLQCNLTCICVCVCLCLKRFQS